MVFDRHGETRHHVHDERQTAVDLIAHQEEQPGRIVVIRSHRHTVSDRAQSSRSGMQLPRRRVHRRDMRHRCIDVHRAEHDCPPLLRQTLSVVRFPRCLSGTTMHSKRKTCGFVSRLLWIDA